MLLSRKIFIWLWSLLLVVMLQMPWLHAFKSEIGYDSLAAEVLLPDGSGEVVLMGEAGSTSYMPNVADGQFTSKTINDVTGENLSPSSHATSVGYNFFGTAASIVSQTDTVNVYSAVDWFLDGYLRLGNNLLAPAVETSSVQNHSWIALLTQPEDEELVHRLDLAINRDSPTVVVAVNNGATSALPEFLNAAYNAISVGLSSGNHSHGTTTIYGTGRIKPEIVAPESLTSWATPVVASSALLVKASAKSLFPADPTPLKPDVVKALLLAGATKEEFGWEWDRTVGRPIDEIYGVGEVNVQRSYHILASGKQSPYPAMAAVQGWNRNAIVAGSSDYYFFEVPAGNVLSRLSIVITWNREVVFNIGSGTTPAALGELGLKLHAASAADPALLTSVIDQSDSAVDNIEHIYKEGVLAAGWYAIEVVASATSPNTDYALAWRGRVTPAIISYQTFADVVFENSGLSVPETAETGDPNGDGVVNLLAYAFNSSPLDYQASGLPLAVNELPTAGIIDDGGAKLTLTYKVRNVVSDLSYHVDWSDDLITWDQTGNDIVEISNVPTGNGVTNTVTVKLNHTLASLGGRAFMRLRVVGL